MNPLFAVWNFFATYILQKAPYMVGFLTLLGYCLMGKKWYDTLAGTLKAIIGMLILNAGSGGLTSNFRPILAGLKDRFNLTACVIDPYYGQNAVTAGVEETFGKGFSMAMQLLLIAFIVNILLVRFNKITKCRTLFTTGHVQVQQAATAYWLIMFALPGLLENSVALMIVMAVILGAYWAVGSNLTVKPMQELTDGAGFADLMTEYGCSEALTSEPLRSEGYYISDASYINSVEYVEGSMMLEQPGQVSAPLRSAQGVHLVEYIGDVTPGEVPLSDIDSAVRAAALAQKQADYYAHEREELLSAANVKYYPERLH